MRWFALVLIGTALIGGCMTPPRNMTVIERGPKPDLNQALEIVHENLRRTLKDYDSLKDFSVVYGEIWPISATNMAFDFEQAWMLCVEYNAKNSYGAYTGIKQHGYPMRTNETGRPVLLSTANWRTHTNGNCN